MCGLWAGAVRRPTIGGVDGDGDVDGDAKLQPARRNTWPAAKQDGRFPLDGLPAREPQRRESARSRSAGTAGIADPPPLASFTDPGDASNQSLATLLEPRLEPRPSSSRPPSTSRVVSDGTVRRSACARGPTVQFRGAATTLIGSASSAPRAIPMSARPRTTGTVSPDFVRQSMESESGWTGLRRRTTSNRPYRNASLTAVNLLSSPSVMCVTTKTGSPSLEESYPLASSARSQRGGLHSDGCPSVASSKPSIRRPAIQPRSGGEPSGIGAPVKPRGSWRTDAASEAVTRPASAFVDISFALRGAPCGYHAHSTFSSGPCHDQQSCPVREPNGRPTLLVDRVFDIFDGDLPPVVQNRGGFLKGDATTAKGGECLLRTPIEHS